MGKKKLLFVYDYMMSGGTSTAILSLFDAIDKDKYDIDLLLYKNEGEYIDLLPDYVNLLDEAAIKSKIKDKYKKFLISIFNGKIFSGLFHYYKNRKNSAKRLKMAVWQASETAHVNISRKINKEYDAVIGYIESWAAHYAVSNKVKAKKRIIWIHLDVEKSYMIPEIDKKMYKKADSIVTVSAECRDNLAKHFPKHRKKILCIENILDVKNIRKSAEQSVDFELDKSKLNVVSSCRLSYYHKGLDRVLKALNDLKNENVLKDFVWYILGDGLDKARMEKYIAENGLDPYVKLLGLRLNPFAYEKDADLFFLPSRFEGKPMAVTEAQILGLPCAVTNYASAAEQVNDGVDGIIIENSEQGIYEFLKNLCLGKINLKELKENTLKKDFSNEETLKKIEELL